LLTAPRSEGLPPRLRDVRSATRAAAMPTPAMSNTVLMSPLHRVDRFRSAQARHTSLPRLSLPRLSEASSACRRRPAARAPAPRETVVSTAAHREDRHRCRDAGIDRHQIAWVYSGAVDQRGRPVNTGTSRNSENASEVANTCPVPWCFICSVSPPSPANVTSMRSSRGGRPFVAVKR